MSIQSSINQAVNGMMSMIMPMSLLKEQGKVKQIKAEQEALKKTNEELRTSNDELMTSNEDLKTSNDKLTKKNEELTKKNDDELGLWAKLLAHSPRFAGLDYSSLNPYSAGDQMAGTMSTQRVQSRREKRKSQMENLQKAFKNIGMGGGNDNG